MSDRLECCGAEPGEPCAPDCSTGRRRVDIKAILRDPARKRALLVRAIYAIQAVEDPTMTLERAEAAYDAAMAKPEEKT